MKEQSTEVEYWEKIRSLLTPDGYCPNSCKSVCVCVFLYLCVYLSTYIYVHGMYGFCSAAGSDGRLLRVHSMMPRAGKIHYGWQGEKLAGLYLHCNYVFEHYLACILLYLYWSENSHHICIIVANCIVFVFFLFASNVGLRAKARELLPLPAAC